jgi:hypothetical protein
VSAAKHTPGPWKDGPVFNKDGRAIFFTDSSKPGKWQRRVDGGHCGTFEAADARLIAAAPTTAEKAMAFTMLVERYMTQDLPEGVDAAEAALSTALYELRAHIAKATGSAS